MIDSHAHLQVRDFDPDRPAVIARALAEGVEAIINIGIDLPSSRAAVDLARGNPALFAAAGLHPTSPVADLEPALLLLHRLVEAERGRVVAIGEIGLDYHWKEVPPADQEVKLRRQLGMALELDLPVVIHCREALPDLLALLEGEAERPRGVFHCFAGGPAEAERALSMGFHISFCGNVTYPSADALREAARAVPPERLLLETDSPYLPPQGRRGRRNEPSFGLLTRDALATLHGLPPSDLDRITTGNTCKLFGLKLPA